MKTVKTALGNQSGFCVLPFQKKLPSAILEDREGQLFAMLHFLRGGEAEDVDAGFQNVFG